VVALLLDRADCLVPLQRGAMALIAMAQEVARNPHAPAMLLLTSGAQTASPVFGSASSNGGAHGCCWGLARIIRLEHASVRMLAADLSHLVATQSAPDALATEASLALKVAAESELSWNGSDRFAARLRGGTRLTSVSSKANAQGPWAAFVSGGLGGLGLHAAGVLLDVGAARLVLSSRSGHIARDGQGLAETLKSVCSRKAVVELLACDVGANTEMLAVLQRMSCGPTVDESKLRVIMHLAGVGDRGLIATLQPWRIGFNFGPKAVAAGHLHHGSMAASLRCFMSYSSVSCSLGNVGQGSYGAGNATLDAIACARRSNGLHGSTVQWPLVEGAGIGAASVGGAAKNFKGMAAISLDEYTARAVSSARVPPARRWTGFDGRPARRIAAIL
jgi:hypothetical protein